MEQVYIPEAIPVDVWRIIINLLDLKTQTSLELVSREFQFLVQNFTQRPSLDIENLAMELGFSLERIETRIISIVRRFSKHIKQVRICTTFRLNIVGLTPMFSSCFNLTSLVLLHPLLFGPRHEVGENFAHFLRSCENLEELVLHLPCDSSDRVIATNPRILRGISKSVKRLMLSTLNVVAWLESTYQLLQQLQCVILNESFSIELQKTLSSDDRRGRYSFSSLTELILSNFVVEVKIVELSEMLLRMCPVLQLLILEQMPLTTVKADDHKNDHQLLKLPETLKVLGIFLDHFPYREFIQRFEPARPFLLLLHDAEELSGIASKDCRVVRSDTAASLRDLLVKDFSQWGSRYWSLGLISQWKFDFGAKTNLKEYGFNLPCRRCIGIEWS